MPAIDFITAFGRLLRDGSLRDNFARNPELVALQLDVMASERASLLKLIPEALEFQALVLLRKRLDVVRNIIPETCRRLQESEWPVFSEFARNYWPSDAKPIGTDAHEFCRYLKLCRPGRVNPAEWHRLEFAFSHRCLAIHRIRQPLSGPKEKSFLQIFVRVSAERWHEIHLRFAL